MITFMLSFILVYYGKYLLIGYAFFIILVNIIKRS